MKTTAPRVSIIIPCYNQAHFLPDALRSVHAQTHQNWECLIVNDGSSDDTETIALNWCEKDSRFQYFKKDNGGLADARNYGIRRCTGDFVLPLDADDKICSQYSEKALDAFREDQNLSIVYSRARFFGTSDETWELPPYNYQLLLVRPLIFCSGVFRKRDYDKVGGYDLNMRYGWEDWEFWINLIGATNGSVRRLDYLGFYYRQHSDSMMTTLMGGSDFNNRLQETKEYLYLKHKQQYHSAFGSYISIIHELVQLKRKNFEFDKFRQGMLYRSYKRIKRTLDQTSKFPWLPK